MTETHDRDGTRGGWPLEAEVPELAGIMVYASTREEAIARAEALALRLLAENIKEDGQPAEAARQCVGSLRTGTDLGGQIDQLSKAGVSHRGSSISDACAVGIFPRNDRSDAGGRTGDLLGQQLCYPLRFGAPPGGTACSKSEEQHAEPIACRAEAVEQFGGAHASPRLKELTPCMTN